MIWFKPRKAKNIKSLCINWKELKKVQNTPKTKIKTKQG